MSIQLIPAMRVTPWRTVQSLCWLSIRGLARRTCRFRLQRHPHTLWFWKWHPSLSWLLLK